MCHGILAVGDSITNACSRDLVVGGVPPRSWVQWVAVSTGLPLSVHARPGASSSGIKNLIPATLGDYAIGLAYVGVNNTISWRRWRRDDLREDLAGILARMSGHCETVAVMQIPTTLGHSKALAPYGPFLRRRVREAQKIIAEVTAEAGATLIECTPIREHIWIDGVHPTSCGHLSMGNAALRALGLPGIDDFTREAERPEFDKWRRQERARFMLVQPVRGIVGWLFGR